MALGQKWHGTETDLGWHWEGTGQELGWHWDKERDRTGVAPEQEWGDIVTGLG